jgi:hypothetical protein
MIWFFLAGLSFGFGLAFVAYIENYDSAPDVVGHCVPSAPKGE